MKKIKKAKTTNQIFFQCFFIRFFYLFVFYYNSINDKILVNFFVFLRIFDVFVNHINIKHRKKNNDSKKNTLFFVVHFFLISIFFVCVLI